MRKKHIIDVTGTPLTPSLQGRKCLGKGEYPGYECCCDECDYFLYCFPQFDWRLKKSRFEKRAENRLKILLGIFLISFFVLFLKAALHPGRDVVK